MGFWGSIHVEAKKKHAREKQKYLQIGSLIAWRSASSPSSRFFPSLPLRRAVQRSNPCSSLSLGRAVAIHDPDPDPRHPPLNPTSLPVYASFAPARIPHPSQLAREISKKPSWNPRTPSILGRPRIRIPANGFYGREKSDNFRGELRRCLGLGNRRRRPWGIDEGARW